MGCRFKTPCYLALHITLSLIFCLIFKALQLGEDFQDLNFRLPIQTRLQLTKDSKFLIQSEMQAREKRTSKPVKSPYGVQRYCNMAVSQTRSHLL